MMNLPSNERRTVESQKTFKKIWLYGLPFSGKTYLANEFPNVLMLNTDGNVKFVDAPYVAIRDKVTVEGRITKRVFAWQVFKDTVEELEKKDNTFETIVVDLIEDTYEYCRLFMYDKLGIEHESDDSYRAWDKVRQEFLSTIKRLLNLDYNIILISHEDDSKDITKKGGDKLTSVKPNIADKVALKLSGMVDLVARVICDEGKRTISFKTNEVIFGGGRLNIRALEIPCDYDSLVGIYGITEEKTKKQEQSKVEESPKQEEEKPRKRRSRTEEETVPEEAPKEVEVKQEEKVEEEQPKVEEEKTAEEPIRKRTRRVRS